MRFSVLVHPADGHFEASLAGVPDVRAAGPTRQEALASLEKILEKQVEQGELISLEIGRKGLAGIAGKYRDDPVLQDICDEAYRLRDADQMP